ncbi:MAG: 2-C-methyl-D-erythritol 2,4-cyclodiphosphate synthase [Candidatus Omnitrophota bacterium]|jgi:2-C-methyl-D-erythritol 2,4-cyclodiphosphate synthase|nr:MAG: 2-C-methyl-D-erythritol 2,4-cyclodiphosphate synthase [Candidatus Omnitrophota bacterium]
MDYRIGLGYDIHRLVRARPLFIGGLRIKFYKGLLGHSDADVLLHAICDSILGASSSPDIGELFPDTSPKYKDACSVSLLKAASRLVKAKGYRINNIDAVVVLERPRISPYKKKIIKNIAKILGMDYRRVNLKGKTNEGLGAIGQKNAIASYAVAVLVKKGDR